VILPHEHVFVDLRCMFDPPREASEVARAHQPFNLETIGWIRYNYFRHYDNVLLGDDEAAAAEITRFRRYGGGTIVDVTPVGIGRDPLALARVSRATGVHIVMATGYYVGATHPADVAKRDHEDLAAQMIAEITDGAVLDRPTPDDQDWVRDPQSTSVRAGVIKVGCSFPLAPDEKKVLRAAAKAQRSTGAAITIHVGRHDRSALEIIDVLAEADADLARTILGHLDVRVERLETLDEIASSGCFLEFDLFGHEISYYPTTGPSGRDMPSDGQRLDLLQHVLERGHAARILISQDICTKHRLVQYGGHGYGYIPECVAPRMLERGWSEETVRRILVVNPAHALALPA
jgi:phosphotriesterase-related protein